MINTEPEASYKQLPFQQYYGQISMYLCMKNNLKEECLGLKSLNNIISLSAATMLIYNAMCLECIM